MQNNTICLLTGANGGIGQATAKLLDSMGVTLILQGRNQEKLLSLQQSLQGNHRILVGDLTLATDRIAMINTAFADKSNAPNILINNAGVSKFSAFSQVSEADIEQLISMNLTATISLTHLFLAQFSSQQACTLVNVGSAFGAIGFPGYSLYCASKFGLKGFTEALARELTDTPKRICYFAPRATNTAINNTQVNNMNQALGNHTDSPELVAQALVNLINSNKKRCSVGWPEKFFARLNGLLPELVDQAIGKNANKIISFTHGEK